MSYLTLQLLYYRSWVSRIKYTHVKAGTHGKPEHTDSRNTRTAGTHGKPEHYTHLLSVLVVTHIHPIV
jgi:hypothetical protein